MPSHPSYCSIKNCNKVAFYKVKSKFFCDEHKELAYAYARYEASFDDFMMYHKASNDYNISKLSEIK